CSPGRRRLAGSPEDPALRRASPVRAYAVTAILFLHGRGNQNLLFLSHAGPIQLQNIVLRRYVRGRQALFVDPFADDLDVASKNLEANSLVLDSQRLSKGGRNH